MTLVVCRALIKQHARFRKQCNDFFIDLVSSVCFKDNTPPCSDIILHLLSFLMVESKCAPIFRRRTLFLPWPRVLQYHASFLHVMPALTIFFCYLPGKRQMLTKVLSPFDDSVDKNPVVRSVVLKLLLKYR